MKKSIYIYIFLFATILPLCYFGVHTLYLNAHRAFIFKSIKHNNLQKTDTIYISPYQLFTNCSNIKWKHNNKEIVFNNNTYDIISITNYKTRVKIIAFNDEKETHLKNKLAELFNNDFNSKSMTTIKNFLSLITVLNSHQIIHLIPTKTFCFAHLQVFKLKQGYSSIEYLPPIYA